MVVLRTDINKVETDFDLHTGAIRVSDKSGNHLVDVLLAWTEDTPLSERIKAIKDIVFGLNIHRESLEERLGKEERRRKLAIYVVGEEEAHFGKILKTDQDKLKKLMEEANY